MNRHASEYTSLASRVRIREIYDTREQRNEENVIISLGVCVCVCASVSEYTASARLLRYLDFVMGRCESTIAASTGPLTRSKSDARSELVAVAAVRRVVIAPAVWWVTGPVED